MKAQPESRNSSGASRAPKAAGPITVQCLGGRCVFVVDEGPRQLSPGFRLWRQGGRIHALEEAKACALLVSILYVKDNGPSDS